MLIMGPVWSGEEQKINIVEFHTLDRQRAILGEGVETDRDLRAGNRVTLTLGNRERPLLDPGTARAGVS